MKAREMREKSVAELELILAEQRRELFNLRVRHYTGQLQKTSDLRELRREIARLNTIISEMREV